jgi:hypothetical protein
MSLDDWSRSAGPVLREMLAQGAVGVLHTGPAGGNTTVAAREVGANPAHDVRALRTGGAREGLGEIFSRDGRTVAIIGTAAPTPAQLRAYALVGPDALRASTALRAYRIADATSPIGARTDVQAMAIEMTRVGPEADLLIADIADGALLDAALANDPVLRERWIARVLSRADIVINAARIAVGEHGVVMVVSAPGPRAREARNEADLGTGTVASDVDGDHLGAVVISRPGRGLLISETTGVPGLVSLVDLAPTIAQRSGVGAHPSMTGDALNVERGADAVGRARRLERDLAAAARARPVVALALFGAVGFAALLTALLFLARRGRAPRGRAPIHLRDLALVLFTAACCAPLVLLFDDGWRAAAVAGIVAVVARMAIGARWCAPVVACLGLAPLVWTLVDPVTVATSTVGAARADFLPPGLDPSVVGLAMGAVLVAVGALADARPRMSARPRTAILVLLAAALVVLAQDLRLVAILAAASAWFIGRDTGSSIVRAAVALGALGVLATAAFVAVGGDLLAYPEDLSVWASDHAARLDVVALGALAGVPLALAWWRRRDEAGRAAFGSPGLRAAIGATVVAAVGIAVAYPGGAVAAAWTLVPAVGVGGALLTGSRSSVA